MIKTKTRAPYKYWQTVENQKIFLDNLSTKLQIKQSNDWFRVTNKNIRENGGHGLLHFYNGSLFRALKTIYPNNEWNEHNKRGNNRELAQQRKILNEISIKLNIKKIEDWYEISTNEIIENGGKKLILKNGNSKLLLLKNLFPYFAWNEEKFTKFPRKYWQNKENHKKFLENLENSLQIKEKKEWYNYRSEDLEKKYRGLRALLLCYKGSLINALEENFPEYQWNRMLSNSTRKFHTVNLKEVIKEILLMYQIQKKQDWYRVSVKQMKLSTKGGKLLYKYGGLYFALSNHYPDQKWNKPKFNDRLKKSNQRLLFISIQNYYSKYYLIEDYDHPNLKFESNNLNMELDIFIPNLNIGFEYQGEQHFDEIPSSFTNMEIYHSRDLEKENLCRSKNIRLFSIPYWCSPSSLNFHNFNSL